MARKNFSEEQCKKFELAANPHEWMLSACSLHDQAITLYRRRGRGSIALLSADGRPLACWNNTNKAAFLLCALALENAIKAFLIYEHPEWISDGYLHDEVCSHRLVVLSEKSTLIPYRQRDQWVLAAFQKGNESWMRYPCSRRASDLQVEPQLQEKLWAAYLRVMQGYGAKLMRLLRKGWQGPHGFAGYWTFEGEYLGARFQR